LKSWWTTFLDFVYPPKCPSCKSEVGEQGAWCGSCLKNIVAVRAINIIEHQLVSLASCWTVCEYTGSLKRIIHDMKFRRKQGNAIYLQWILEKHISTELFAGIDLVIPVPLHEKRLQERGYNQTEAIFKKGSRMIFEDGTSGESLWMPQLLLRMRHTVPQWELKLAQRKDNIKDAFVVTQSEMVKDKYIMLVDDIFTSGITLDECAKVLRKAGARRVCALVVASGAR
jgi:ComF family protein